MSALLSKSSQVRVLGGKRGDRGFSLTEMLAVIIIMTLVSMCMAAGVQFAVREYNRSMIQSESRMLCSTLASVIQDELGNTNTVELEPVQADGTCGVKKFFSVNYGGFGRICAVSIGADEEEPTELAPNAFGKLYFAIHGGGGRLLVSNAAYSIYDFGARVSAFTYDKENKVFHVTLEVSTPNGNPIVDSFDVIPVNNVKEQP